MPPRRVGPAAASTALPAAPGLQPGFGFHRASVFACVSPEPGVGVVIAPSRPCVSGWLEPCSFFSGSSGHGRAAGSCGGREGAPPRLQRAVLLANGWRACKTPQGATHAELLWFGSLGTCPPLGRHQGLCVRGQRSPPTAVLCPLTPKAHLKGEHSPVLLPGELTACSARRRRGCWFSSSTGSRLQLRMGCGEGADGSSSTLGRFGSVRGGTDGFP